MINGRKLCVNAACVFVLSDMFCTKFSVRCPMENNFIIDQSRAPIYEALQNFRQMRVVPFDVPGHKHGKGNPELTEFLGRPFNDLQAVVGGTVKRYSFLYNSKAEKKEKYKNLIQLPEDEWLEPEIYHYDEARRTRSNGKYYNWYVNCFCQTWY